MARSPDATLREMCEEQPGWTRDCSCINVGAGAWNSSSKSDRRCPSPLIVSTVEATSWSKIDPQTESPLMPRLMQEFGGVVAEKIRLTRQIFGAIECQGALEANGQASKHRSYL